MAGGTQRTGGDGAPRARVVSAGNAGVLIDAGARIYIDAFFCGAPRAGPAALVDPDAVDRADLVLVTHAHADHFDAEAVRDVARRTGAAVAGPRAVVRRLARRLDDGALVELEPAESRTPPASCAATVKGVALTAFRTCHAAGHNSYLVESGGMRFYHDGDNEKTQHLDVAALGRVDAAFVCPWQGAGCTEFLERLRPARWFLIHLTDEELDQQAAGTFLPDLMPRVPPGLVTLRPGQEATL